jgi:hypothetical protein
MSANKIYSFKDLMAAKRAQAEAPAPESVPASQPVPDPQPLPDRVPVAYKEPAPELTPVKSATPPQKTTGGKSAKSTPTVSRRPPPETTPVEEIPPLPWDAPHLRVPYAVWERLRELKPGPRVVVEEIYRAAAGWHSDECVISIPKLSFHCKLDEKQVRKYLLEVDGRYVKRMGVINEGTDVSLRGIRFKLLLPRLGTPPQKATPPQSGTGGVPPPNKDKALKESNKKGINRLTPDEIQSFAATVADLLGEGKSFEEIEPRFTSSMHPMDWVTVKSVAKAQAQVGRQKSKT